MIAFVVVATVFAFVVLSTGLFSSERGKEAVYAGLQKTEGSLELRGSIIANTDGRPPSTRSCSTWRTRPAASRSTWTRQRPATRWLSTTGTRRRTSSNIAWTVNFLVGDADNLLENGELAEVTLDVSRLTPSAPTRPFTIEVKPPLGGTMVIARTTPAGLDTVVDLH